MVKSSPATSRYAARSVAMAPSLEITALMRSNVSVGRSVCMNSWRLVLHLLLGSGPVGCTPAVPTGRALHSASAEAGSLSVARISSDISSAGKFARLACVSRCFVATVRTLRDLRPISITMSCSSAQWQRGRGHARLRDLSLLFINSSAFRHSLFRSSRPGKALEIAR